MRDQRSEVRGQGGRQKARLRPLRHGIPGLWPLASGLFLLAACGFQPVYGTGASDQGPPLDLAQVSVEAKGQSASVEATVTQIPRRYAEHLAATITSQINPTGRTVPTQFNLAITFTESDNVIFVKPDGTAGRGNLLYDSHYTVIRREDHKKIAEGNIRRVSTYNMSPNADYAFYVSIEDARKQGMDELAQDYKLRLAALIPVLADPNAIAIDEDPMKNGPKVAPEARDLVNPNQPQGSGVGTGN